MKQLIVMVSMIMVGIAIAGIVSGFGDKAVDLGKSTGALIDGAHIATVPGASK